MKKLKTVFVYAAGIGGFIILMYAITVLGNNLQAGKNMVSLKTEESSWQIFLQGLVNNTSSPLALLLAQIIVIIVAARCFGWLFKKIRQPAVMGEIVAGIVLGPSLFGHYLPGISGALFPVQSLGTLKFLSQIGLILFMFIVGMELNLQVLREKAKEAVVISHASIVVPFALGMGLAYFMYSAYAPAGVQFLPFALFIGIAMSITAFPVLARIVQERGIQKTRLGSIAITCAAVDDISAWCILATVIAVARAGSFASGLYIILLAAAYVLFMLMAVSPLLRRISTRHINGPTKTLVAVFILLLIISCYITEAIGIHALFGAFMFGAIMPEHNGFRNVFIQKVEDVAVILLLPLFFVYSGLRTEIGLLNEPRLWTVTAVIIALAILGKFAGSAIAAKAVGQNWKDSLTLGALMNTRGLVELVALNIGYDLGLLTPSVFTMMVMMALVTTAMTGPALDIINRLFKTEQENQAPFSTPV